jgi:ABC-type polar amino acid transport system ATPase subunit
VVSKNDLTLLGEYELYGEKRYRICVNGTNIVINVKARDEKEAFSRALQILEQVGLTDEALHELRSIVGEKALCK